MHTLSQLILWCYFDRKSSSPRKLLWGPMWNTHNKASCAHTGCWDWAGNQKQQLGWEIISCQERLDFELIPATSLRSWVEKSSFLYRPGLPTRHLCCGSTVSWPRDTPTTGVDPMTCQAPIQGLFFWLQHWAHSLLLTLFSVFLSLRP